MARITWRMLFPLAVALVLPICARSQTATYHLHNEISPELGGAFLTLKTIGPDRTSIARASANLKNQPVGQYLIESWRTVPGVPNVNGTIPAGSTFTVTLWMEKSSNFGTMFPVVEIYLLPSTGPRTLICSVTGSTALSTSLVTYTFFPTTTTPVSMTASDRFQLEVSVNVTQAPGNHNSQAEVDIEGTLNGQYDSRIIAPLPVPPSISNVSPTSGAAGASVTVSGSNFGATQGSSTVTFNGTAATPTSWGDMTIIAPVPSVATTGPVEVTVSGSVSNGVNFTVITAGTLSGMVTRASDGSALAGVLVEALQAGVVKGSTTTAANGSYSLSNSHGGYV
jgi:IPT/TIG domain